jgi:hypothetical protein
VASRSESEEMDRQLAILLAYVEGLEAKAAT